MTKKSTSRKKPDDKIQQAYVAGYNAGVERTRHEFESLVDNDKRMNEADRAAFSCGLQAMAQMGDAMAHALKSMVDRHQR